MVLKVYNLLILVCVKPTIVPITKDKTELSGLQKWNGAAETLNKNPTDINNKLM